MGKPIFQGMFRGATKVTIDDKGRVVVPARYRGLLVARGDGRVVVTVDRDQCLLIYPVPEWEQIEQHLRVAGGNRSAAARSLGISREGLRLKMKRLGLL